MSMQRTDTAFSTRLTKAGLALALAGVVMVATACGDDAGRSDAGAELQAFISLGTDRLSGYERSPVELDSEEAAALARTLDASPGDEVHTALTQSLPAGTTGFGFVLSGCEETGARLIVTGTVISAKLTGNEDVDCEEAVYFLAAFHMPTENVPEGAVLD